MRKSWTALLVVLLVVCWCVIGWAAEWPQWRGAARDDISRETGLLKAWPAEGPKLVWKAAGLGKDFASVTIADGLIYTAGVLDKQTCVIALDLDGKPVWKTPNGEGWRAEGDMAWAARMGHEGARAVPTIDDGLAYQLNETGRLAAFDAKTGKEAWALNIAKEFEAKPPKWGYAEAVLIDGKNLICYPGGAKGNMVALDKKTGKTVWTSKCAGDRASYCSVLLVEGNGLRQLITMTECSVLGVNADTGEFLWREPFVNSNKINISIPVYADGLAYFSAGYGLGGMAVKLTVDGKRVNADKVWENKTPDNHHGGIVLVDGLLYGSGDRKQGWACVELKTGKDLYLAKGVGKGSLTMADGMFYCLGENGTMGLVRASAKEFTVVSQFRVPKGGAGPYWAHPVVCGGRLYVRHADVLDAYDLKAQ